MHLIINNLKQYKNQLLKKIYFFAYILLAFHET